MNAISHAIAHEGAPRRLVRSLRALPVGVVLSGVFLLLLGFAIAFPHVVASADPLNGEITQTLQAPGAAHWFGTDRIGRDVFSRVVHGARYSLLIGLSSMLVSLVTGAALGIGAGMSRRFANEACSRIFDVLSAFPPVLLSLFVITFMGQGMVNIAIAVGIAGIPKFGRVLRGETLGVRRADYVTHAVTFGLSRSRAFVRHVLPNVLAVVPVIATIDIGSAIIAVSGLSFLGLGPQPPTPEWGAMLAEGRDVLRVAWWPSVFPGLAITLTVVAFSVLGRHLRHARVAGSGS
ncbi:MAG: ABC transporter permease [Janthinobacterium lividum]